MKNRNLSILAAAGTLCLSLNTYADNTNGQWGQWNEKSHIQNDLVVTVDVSEPDLLDGEIAISEMGSGFAMGTQLAGSEGDGMDTDMELDENGIPVDFNPEQALDALESPIVEEGGLEEGGLVDGFPIMDDRSADELGALHSPMVADTQ